MASRRRKKSNVEPLFGASTYHPDPEPDAEVIERLEFLLKLGRDGRILGFHYACVERGGHLSGGSVGAADKNLMLSAVTRAFFRFGVSETGDDE
jgi:hypothetical protein